MIDHTYLSLDIIPTIVRRVEDRRRENLLTQLVQLTADTAAEPRKLKFSTEFPQNTVND